MALKIGGPILFEREMVPGWIPHLPEKTLMKLLRESAELRRVVEEYGLNGIKCPQSLVDDLKEMGYEIAKRHRKDQQAKLLRLEADAAETRRRGEKLLEVETEIAKLKKELGGKEPE